MISAHNESDGLDDLGSVRALLRAGDTNRAIAILQSKLSRMPEDPELNALLGEAYLSAAEIESALDHFNLALHYDPHRESALFGRLVAHDRLGQGGSAIAACRAFLDANAGHSGATVELARRLYRQGDRDAAASLLEDIVARDLPSSDALNLLGLVVAREFADFERGISLLSRALALDPGFVAARANLGWVLGEMRRYDEAFACLDAVLSGQPGDEETRLMRAHLNLKRGEFAAGWDDFDARNASPDALRRPFRAPRWPRDPLEGRTLLVTAEQGIGDQIMFGSCLPDLLGDDRVRGGRCVVEVEPRLASLFARSFPSALVRASRLDAQEVPWLNDVGIIDFQMPLGSLPSMFRRTREAFPEHRGYLRADPSRIAYWRERLSNLGPPPHVGISWRGGAAVNRRFLRSIALEDLLSATSGLGTHVSLQYGNCDAEVAGSCERAGATLHHWAEVLADYDETAALVCSLDLVISVCTAVVHLSGALGCRVWVLAPWAAEWRYGDAGQTIPWYPSARVLRQDRPGDWQQVLAELRSDMTDLERAKPG